jgi:hypothetical protein
MRTLMIAILIASLAGAAHAQGPPNSKRTTPAKAEQKTEDVAKKKAAEKAYHDALDKIPEAKEKPDPWKSMR